MEVGSRLTTEQRAATVAAVLALGADAPQVLSRIGLGCVEAAEQLLAMERDERAAALAVEVAGLQQPVPAGRELVHRDWIEAAFAGEGDLVREAVAGGGKTSPQARRWMQRRALGRLVGMPGEDADGVAALARVEVEDLVRALAVFGRGALAAGLGGAPAAKVAAVAAKLGEPHGSALVPEVAEAVKSGVDKARAAHVRGVGGASERALVLAGVRRLAAVAASAGGDVPRQLAQRLPVDLGTALLSAAQSAEPVEVDGELEVFRAMVGL